ncbi:MAG TPA: BON domain-containing protein [Candidatus Limnocylindrales bacterium]|nr:BON domain-containing protein [Candidatus Limnocylindrales bacterium]
MTEKSRSERVLGADLPPEDVQRLLGEELPIDQDAVVEPDEIEGDREVTLSEQEWGVPVNPDLRSGETDDPLVAIEEGQTYIPPTDPPFAPDPDDPDGIDSPAREDIEAESDINSRIRDELRADASTSALADRLEIAVVGSIAVIRGQVDGIEDSDAIVEVASRVPGINEVRDETEVVGL